MASEDELYAPVIARARTLDVDTRAVIATDPAGVVLYWNRSAEQLYGWTEQEALGRNVLELTPGELSLGEAEDIMGRLRRGVRWAGEFLVNDKDGSLFTVRVSDTPVHGPDGTLLGIVGVSERVSYLTSR